ncbi:MAG: alpha/beta hydrolase [Bacteroidota bacterium]
MQFIIFFIVLITLIVTGLIFINRLIEKLIGVRHKFSSTFNPAQYRNSIPIKPQIHQFKTFDGLTVCFSQFSPSSHPINGCIILIHGIRYGKEYYYPVAAELVKNGYHCLVPDLRAHGESEGQYCTYGAKEKKDISTLINYAERNLKLEGGISIWAHSMGASIGLLAMEHDPRIRFGILEAPFSDLHLIIQEYVRRKMPFLPKGFVNFVLTLAGRKAGFNPREIKPAIAARNIHNPVMLIHGREDKRITLYHSQEIYNQLPEDTKILFEINNGDHHNIREVWKDEYIERSLQFIKKSFSFLEYS